MSKSRIFLFFCLSFLTGIIVGSIINISQLFWLGFLILGLAFIGLSWSRKWNFVIFGFCLLCFAAGIYKYQISVINQKSDLRQYNDKGVVNVRGAVIEEPEVSKGRMKMKIYARAENQEGKILVTAAQYPEYQYGDELEIFGKLETPRNFEEFDYKNYLAKDDIYSVMYYPEIKILAIDKGNPLYKILYSIKNKFEEKINYFLAEPQASFLDGLILGQKKSIPEELLRSFNKTGTTHIIALSGYNITIVASILLSFLTFLAIGPRYAFWLAVLGISFFVIMTGASASAVRAAVMGILVLVARRESRPYNPTNALVFAGAVMVFLNPKILRFDLGFQLSFLATCGLLYLSPILKEKFKNLPKFLSFKESLASTLSAQIFVLPLLLVSFKNLSLIAPLANILVLPIIPLTMLFGFLTGLAGFVFAPLAQIFSWFVWLFLTYEIKIIEILSKIPLASVNFSFNLFWFIVYYALLIFFLLKIKTPADESGRG